MCVSNCGFLREKAPGQVWKILRAALYKYWDGNVGTGFLKHPYSTYQYYKAGFAVLTFVPERFVSEPSRVSLVWEHNFREALVRNLETAAHSSVGTERFQVVGSVNTPYRQKLMVLSRGTMT